MREKFVKNLAFLLFANVLVKPIWIFGIDRTVQVSTGPVEYGNYFTATNFAFLLSVILDIGINNFTNRSVSRNASRSGEYIFNLLRLKGILGLAYISITMLFAYISGISGWLLQLIFISSLNMLLLSFILHFRAYIAALHQFKVDSAISVLDKLLAIIFVGTSFFFFRQSGARSIILLLTCSQTIALLITATVAFTYLNNKVTITRKLWTRKYTKMILLKSFPFALLVLQMTIYGRIDGILLNRLLPEGTDETGIYASGYRLLDAATQFGFLTATLLLPLFSKAIKNKLPVMPLVKLSSALVLLASSFVGLFSYVYRSEIVSLLYHTNDARYATVLAILMCSFIPIASIYVLGTLLTANGSLKQLNRIAVLGIFTNLLANVFLIPRFGAIGAAWAALITQCVVSIAHVYAVVSTRLIYR